MGFRNLYTLSAAGTALAASSTETVLASYVFPTGGMCQVGRQYRVRAAVIATATASTDTLRVQFRSGPTTLTGTLIADGTAVDVADNDKVFMDLVGVCRAGGVIVWSGSASVEGAEGTATMRVAFEEQTITDPKLAHRFELTGKWSTTGVNSCRCDLFIVDEVV